MRRSYCETGADHEEALRRWCAGTPGRFLVARETACLGQLLPALFGFYLVQVGHLGVLTDALDSSPIRSKILLGPSAAASARVVQVVGDPTRLCLATDSVDVVVLPHALDFSCDPHQVLREAERVLIPEGRVIILGFNPWSPWGMWHKLRGKEAFPWHARFMAPRRVHDWLTLLGFDLEAIRYLMFSPPLAGPGIMDRLGFLETFGQRWWPLLGGVYLIQAVKRVSTLTPIETRWEKARAKILGAGAIEPTARHSTRG